MKITIRTRSQNKSLHKRMLKFIPKGIEAVCHTGYNSWKHASTFLHDAIDTTNDILIVLDEDAFIIDWNGVEQLCQFIRQNNYTHAGIPDGGIISHRTHSFLNINPFFAIFNCDTINPLKSKVSRELIDKSEFEIEMEERLKPDWLTGEFNHDTIEPFSGLFYWLAKIGNPLFLEASTLDDQISTEVKGLHKEGLCLHSWYSRLYETDDVTKMRIDSIYKIALKAKKHTVNLKTKRNQFLA